jgi:hypothetical protein
MAVFNYVSPWPETTHWPLRCSTPGDGMPHAAMWTSRLRSGNFVWRHTCFFICSPCPSASGQRPAALALSELTAAGCRLRAAGLLLASWFLLFLLLSLSRRRRSQVVAAGTKRKLGPLWVCLARTGSGSPIWCCWQPPQSRNRNPASRHAQVGPVCHAPLPRSNHLEPRPDAGLVRPPQSPPGVSAVLSAVLSTVRSAVACLTSLALVLSKSK